MKIVTYSNKIIDVENLLPEDIDACDMAHCLSSMKRGRGHFPSPISCAVHNLNCQRQAQMQGCSDQIQLGCLLQDADLVYQPDERDLFYGKRRLDEETVNRIQATIAKKYIGRVLTEKEKQVIADINLEVTKSEYFMHFPVKNQNRPSLKAQLIVDREGYMGTEILFLDALYNLTNTASTEGYVKECAHRMDPIRKHHLLKIYEKLKNEQGETPKTRGERER